MVLFHRGWQSLAYAANALQYKSPAVPRYMPYLSSRWPCMHDKGLCYLDIKVGFDVLLHAAPMHMAS